METAEPVNVDALWPLAHPFQASAAVRDLSLVSLAATMGSREKGHDTEKTGAGRVFRSGGCKRRTGFVKDDREAIRRVGTLAQA